MFAQDRGIEVIWLKIYRVHFLGKTCHDSLRTVHELSMWCDFFVLTLLLVRASCFLSSIDNSKTLTLVSKLSESVPVFDVTWCEDSVSHLRLVLLSLIPVAEAPTSCTHVFGVVVSVVVDKRLSELFNCLFSCEEYVCLRFKQVH